MSEEHIQESPSAHGHEHPAPETHAPAAPPFTRTEVAAMHDEDRKAAGNIVMLMVAIFVAGVIGYSVVDYIVSQGF